MAFVSHKGMSSTTKGALLTIPKNRMAMTAVFAMMQKMMNVSKLGDVTRRNTTRPLGFVGGVSCGGSGHDIALAIEIAT